MSKKAGVPILKSSHRKIALVSGAQKYRDLRIEVSEAGILDRDYFYYGSLIIISLLGFFFSCFLLLFELRTILAPVFLVCFLFFSIQLSGLFHDAGHRAIFKSARNNDILGYLIAFIANVSFSYWKYKHNKHHANPNEIDSDPDLDIPLFSYTTHKVQKNFFTRAMFKYQSYLYYPLGLFSLFYLRQLGLFYIKDNFKTLMLLEILAIAVSSFFWYVLPFIILGPYAAMVFIVLTNFGVGVYLANIFAPNHKGMPQVEKGAKISFIEQQINTARNVRSNWLLDILYVGLNYQIEHHLFPNCPRNKLGQITPYVKRLCREMKLDYTEAGVIESNKIIVRELRKASLVA